jgi:hypothetical protein
MSLGSPCRCRRCRRFRLPPVLARSRVCQEEETRAMKNSQKPATGRPAGSTHGAATVKAPRKPRYRRLRDPRKTTQAACRGTREPRKPRKPRHPTRIGSLRRQAPAQAARRREPVTQATQRSRAPSRNRPGERKKPRKPPSRNQNAQAAPGTCGGWRLMHAIAMTF